MLHHREDRILAHVQLCWLALLLIRVVENATSDTWRNTRHELDRMHLVTLATSDGQVSQRSPTPAGERAVLTARKLPTPAPALPATVDADPKALLRRVKLGRLLDTLPERLTLAWTESLPHADFLTLVLSDEVDRRERQSAELRACAARLDPSMRLATFSTESTARQDPRALERAVFRTAARRAPRRPRPWTRRGGQDPL